MQKKNILALVFVFMIGVTMFWFPSYYVFAGEFDTEVLRHDAEFRKEISEDLFWVPLNVLGEPQLTVDELTELKRKPQELKEKINTLYDAIHYLQVSGMNVYYRLEDTHQRWHPGLTGGVSWTHVAPATYSIEENKASPASMTNVINYLLQDSYEEVGYFWGSPRILGATTRPYFLNYIKHDGQYYIFNPEPYILFEKVGLESGDISDYQVEENFASLHETGDLQTFVSHYLEVEERVTDITTFTAETAFPFAFARKNLNSVIAIPDTFPEENLNPLIEGRKEYVFVSPPWTCAPAYTGSRVYTDYMPRVRPPGEIRIKSGMLYTTIADQEGGAFGVFFTGAYQILNELSLKGKVVNAFGDPMLTGFVALLSYNPREIGFLNVSVDLGPGYYLGDTGDVFAELGWKVGLETAYNLRKGIDVSLHGGYRLLQVEENNLEMDYSGWEFGGGIVIRF